MDKSCRLFISALILGASICFGLEPKEPECPAVEDPGAKTAAEWAALDLECAVQRLVAHARSTLDKEQRIDRYAAALPHAELLMASRADEASYQLLLQAQYGAGQKERARATGQQWLQAFPASSRAYYQMAGVLAAERQLDSALEHYRKAVELAADPADGLRAKSGVAFILEKLHRDSEAILVYEEIGALDEAARVKLNVYYVHVNPVPVYSPEVRAALEAEKKRLEEQMKAEQLKAQKNGG